MGGMWDRDRLMLSTLACRGPPCPRRRQKGFNPLSVYLTTYKLGDYVDIKVNASVHKGMPHKFYHGKTGRVWNVTKRAIGVELLKQVGPRHALMLLAGARCCDATKPACSPLGSRSSTKQQQRQRRRHLRWLSVGA